MGAATGTGRDSACRSTGPALVAAVDSDRLYPLSHSQELADALPGCEAVDLLHSDVGHDGFLAESAALNELVEGLLLRVDYVRDGVGD